jgi:hypothetical protein
LHFAERRKWKATRVHAREDRGLSFGDWEWDHALVKDKKRQSGSRGVEEMLVGVLDATAITNEGWRDIIEKRQGVEVARREDDRIDFCLDNTVFELDAPRVR